MRTRLGGTAAVPVYFGGEQPPRSASQGALAAREQDDEKRRLIRGGRGACASCPSIRREEGGVLGLRRNRRSLSLESVVFPRLTFSESESASRSGRRPQGVGLFPGAIPVGVFAEIARPWP